MEQSYQCILLLSFKPWAQQCEQAEDDEHGRDHKGVRSEADETQRGYRKANDRGNVIFFLQPLIESLYTVAVRRFITQMTTNMAVMTKLIPDVSNFSKEPISPPAVALTVQ